MADELNRIYIRFNGRVLGPFNHEKAVDLVRRGQITRQHELSPDGLSWKSAEQFPSLFNIEAKAPREKVQDSKAEVMPASPQVSSQIWYANIDGENQGPVDESTLRDWIQAGKVVGGTFVWRQGMQDWIIAETLRPEWFQRMPQIEIVKAQVTVDCPHCQTRLSIHASQSGTAVTCPKCQGKFQSPLPIASLGLASNIGSYSAPSAAAQVFASKKTAAGICGILLGGLGIHKFILGLNNAAVIMLVIWSVGIITGGCFIVPVFASIAMNIIGLIEGIIYLTKSDEEFYQTYAIKKREWF